MKVSEINTLLKNPEWNSILLDYFLSGVRENSKQGIKIELLYFALPLLHDDIILKRLNSSRSDSTLSTFLSLNEVRLSFYEKNKRIVEFKKLTNDSLILLANRKTLEIGEFVSLETQSKYDKERDKVKKTYAKGAFNLGAILSKEEYINLLLRLLKTKMKTIVKRILLFDNDDNKREVKLKSGLNIITGDSKTGKSAIIEIIDYCLFAKRSTIPKGVIDKFTNLYAIVLKVEEKYISIGRLSPNQLDSNKVYFKVETDDVFLENINKEYFTKGTLKALKEGQVELERHLGLSVLDTRPDNDSEKIKYGKASFRSSVSFSIPTSKPNS